MRIKRNGFGFTPGELAQFLGRKELERHLITSFRSNPLHPAQLALEATRKFCDLEYLFHPIFETPQILCDILSCTQKAKEEDQISQERVWMGIYFDNEIQKGVHPVVSIRYIDSEVGYGVFSEQRIPPCAFVGEYTGVIQEWKRKPPKDEVYSVKYTVWGWEKKMRPWFFIRD